MINRTKRNRRKIHYHNPYILYGVLFMILYFYLLGSCLYYLSFRRKKVVIISDNFYGDLILFTLLKGEIRFNDNDNNTIILLRGSQESVTYYNCIDNELRPLVGSIISRLGENIKIWKLTDAELLMISSHTKINYDLLKRCSEDLFHNNGYTVYNLSECKSTISSHIVYSNKISSQYDKNTNMYYIQTDQGPIIADLVISTNTQLHDDMSNVIVHVTANYPSEILPIKETSIKINEDSGVCMINSDINMSISEECKIDTLINFDNIPLDTSDKMEYPYKGSIDDHPIIVFSKEGGLIDNVYYKIGSSLKIGDSSTWFPKPFEEDKFRYSLLSPRSFDNKGVNAHPFYLPPTTDYITSAILVAKAMLY